MTQTIYQLDVSLALNLEQIKKIVLSMPIEQQNEILLSIISCRQNIDEKKLEDAKEEKFQRDFIESAIRDGLIKVVDNSDMIAVFERISQNAKERGLTEEILEELLSDES
jgi:hypothetical protein